MSFLDTLYDTESEYIRLDFSLGTAIFQPLDMAQRMRFIAEAVDNAEPSDIAQATRDEDGNATMTPLELARSADMGTELLYASLVGLLSEDGTYVDRDGIDIKRIAVSIRDELAERALAAYAQSLEEGKDSGD